MTPKNGVGVVYPCGAQDDPLDTLESILYYTPSPRTVVVVDDTGRADFASQATAMSGDVVCVRGPSWARRGTQGGLWAKIGVALRYLVEHAAPSVILKLDTDAVMIGPGLFEAARTRFAADERLGILGSYRIRADGAVRDYSWGAGRLRRETSWVLGFRHPTLRHELRRLHGLAKPYGYESGEHAIGGAYLLSARLATWWLESQQLANRRLNRSMLPEDMLAALVARSGGFIIGDFGRPDDPLALFHRGLPAAPEDLVARGKAVTHSVRFFGDRTEDDIRRVFREARRRGTE